MGGVRLATLPGNTVPVGGSLTTNLVVQGRVKTGATARGFGATASPLGPSTGYIRHSEGRALAPLPASALEAGVLKEPAGPKGRLRIGVGRVFDPAIIVDRSTVPASEWTVLPNGWRIWSAELVSPGALGVRVHLQSLALPNGVRVLVYDPLNPATARMPIASETLGGEREAWAQTTFAEKVVLECQVPPHVDPATVAFTVTGLSHIYKLPMAKARPNAEWCHLDVTCYPEWAQEAAGVARIEFVDGGNTYLCTGCLLNSAYTNALADYFLTAHHCVGNQNVASTVDFYWFYQTRICNGFPPDVTTVPSTHGADFLAGGSASDFAFLRLRQAAPDQVYYLGWTTALPSTTETLACIQHPTGDAKAISFGNTVGYDSGFWQVQWSSGDTEEGSSGSPLLNANHQVIGQLYGGNSSCVDQTGIDTFGRFDVSYNTLRQWIDAVSIAKGTYNGLFQDTKGVSPQSSGSFTITTTTTGKFTGKLQLGMTQYPMSGQFDGAGSATLNLTHAGQSSIDVVLQLDLYGGTDRITGTVGDTFGAWIAELTGVRAVFDGKTALAPQAGRYTLLLPGNPASTTQPGGDSYGTLTVDSAGRIRLTGLLADGTRIAQSAVLSKNGQWPFFIPLYAGGGSVFGWITFDSSAAEDLGGKLTWTRPGLLGARNYPVGFVVPVSATGSVFNRPPPGQPILNFSAATATLVGGNLAMNITNGVTLSSNGASSRTNKFRLAFSSSAGTFQGSVLDPVSLKPVSFGGVALQKQNRGAGCFLNNAVSGEFLLQPAQ